MNKNHEMDMNHDNKKELNTIKDTDVYNLLLKIPAGKVSTYGDTCEGTRKSFSFKNDRKILEIIQTRLRYHVTEW